ncbi:MAG: DUF91 domain-containing protein [Candidatus Hydrogenedentes bacterium]|nr:DUF91 domain-containing protein [Candidatus Hydrogenedentota bacterium]
MLLHAFTDAEINKPNICRFLSKNSGLTGSTVGRRADTIVAWLKRVSEFDPENFHSLSIHAHAQAPSAYLQYRASEEGEEHLRLRESLAHNPGLVEEGLALVREEYQFPTHDRADLLFLDSRSRFLAVEVEVDVGPQDVVGLLQAVKYRAMIMVQFGREPTEVRAMLVARRIDPIMCERAKRYGIETREVSQT